MIKSFTALEHKVGERVYQFLCAPDSPLGEVHDALLAMRNHVVHRILEQQKAEADQKKDSPPQG